VLDHLESSEEQRATLLTERFHRSPRRAPVVVGVGQAAEDRAGVTQPSRTSGAGGTTPTPTLTLCVREKGLRLRRCSEKLVAPLVNKRISTALPPLRSIGSTCAGTVPFPVRPAQVQEIPAADRRHAARVRQGPSGERAGVPADAPVVPGAAATRGGRTGNLSGAPRGSCSPGAWLA
jgi:hypothetical protein